MSPFLPRNKSGLTCTIEGLPMFTTDRPRYDFKLGAAEVTGNQPEKAAKLAHPSGG